MSIGRWVSHAGAGVIAVTFIYLSFRHSTELKTVDWIPKRVAYFLDGISPTRNLWGFGLIGAYCAIFLGARLGKPRSQGELILLACLLLLPIGKEVSQIFIEGRHCNASGMAQGVLGVVLGLGVGQLTLRAFCARKPPQPQSNPT